MGDVIICWGNSKTPNWGPSAYHHNIPTLNHWSSIANAVDKRRTFQCLKKEHVSAVVSTENPDTAFAWILSGQTVMARTEVKARLGQGIVVIQKPSQFVQATLYTQFEPQCNEYRVHVAFGQVINVQQKLKRNGVTADPFIRSEANGYVFARKGIYVPPTVFDTCAGAVQSLGLDFGAVDCLYSTTKKKSYVLEVNTAPGIDYNYGIEAYTTAFRQAIAAI